MITREDGKVLANKFTILDGRRDDARYEPAPDDRAMPWDPDREAHLAPGQTYTRLAPQGAPILFERVWTDAANLSENYPPPSREA